jgi:RNA polymerase sigma factor (TIGR02999 family)
LFSLDGALHKSETRLSFLASSPSSSLSRRISHNPPMSDVTRLLNAIEAGEPKAADQLLPLVYEELRKLAVVRMANEKVGQTLQPTALVHEAWLKIAGDGNEHFANRRHFFKAAASAMQQILIDNARRQTAAQARSQPGRRRTA